MDENSRLEPHLLIAQAEAGIRIFEAKIERIRASREPKIAFINDTSSSTAGINLLKEKMADMLKVDNALILAYSSHIADYRRLIARLADVPRLHGGLLLALRAQARARIGELEIRISDLQRTLSREGTFPNRSENAYHYFRHLITTHTNALERQHNVLQAIEARIELYHVIEAETRHLFEEGRALEQEAMRGFELIQVASSGLPRGFHNPGLTVWRTGLREKKNKLPGPSIEELDLIASIRERGVPFPNGWTDEEKQAFARRYLAELAKVNTFVEKNFTEDEFEDAQTAFIFLTDVELAFHLDINKRQDLLNVIRDNGMFFPPIQDYLEEHGVRGISTRRLGDFTMQVGQTYASASQGMSHHEWYTFLVVASWLDGAGRVGPAVNLASNWNATAPRAVGGQTAQPSPTTGRTITLSNGRVVNVQTGGGRIIQGNLQSPNVPRLAKVNEKWTKARPIGSNAQNHLINVDGFASRTGIKGGHNLNSFEAEAQSRGVIVTNRTPHPTVRGVVQMEYRIPVFDMAGNPIPGKFKTEAQLKTVFDPNIISNDQMFRWGQEAMKNGTFDPISNQIRGASSNGLNFIGYVKDGKITNFHPIIE